MEETIYVIENKLDGRVYVGRTKYSIKTRWDSHRTTDSSLGRDMRMLGTDNFAIRVLATGPHT